MRMFVDDLSNDMLSMRLALQSGEMEIIASLAHQLKGTAGSYGFPAITEQAARVEDCVRRAAAPEDVQNAIAVLQDLCMQVQTRGGKLFPGAASQSLPAA
jgi:HPt (histidine-containing phosphotransfer) domain-containing protein